MKNLFLTIFFITSFNSIFSQCSFENVNFSIADSLYDKCMKSFSESDVYFELIEFELSSTSISVLSKIEIINKNEKNICKWKRRNSFFKKFKLEKDQTEILLNSIEKGSYFYYCPNYYSSALPTVIYIKIGSEIVFSLYNEQNRDLSNFDLVNFQKFMAFLQKNT